MTALLIPPSNVELYLNPCRQLTIPSHAHSSLHAIVLRVRLPEHVSYKATYSLQWYHYCSNTGDVTQKGPWSRPESVSLSPLQLLPFAEFRHWWPGITNLDFSDDWMKIWTQCANILILPITGVAMRARQSFGMTTTQAIRDLFAWRSAHIFLKNRGNLALLTPFFIPPVQSLDN